MSDIPAKTGGEPADDAEADLENPEIEELEDEAADGEAGDGEAGDDEGSDAAEAGEGQERQARCVETPRGRARGRAYGEQIRELQSQRAADKAEFDRQLAALMAERRQPSQAEMAAQAEAERMRLEMMSPVEIAAYYHQKTLTEVTQQTQQMARSLWDQNDQREYERMLAQTPAYRRYGPQVEDLRRQAPGVPRRVLLATAIGLRALEQGGAARTRAAAAAERGADRNAVRPSSGRGDVSPERSRRGDDLEERLRNQSI